MGNLAKGSPLIKKLIFFVSYLTRAESHIEYVLDCLHENTREVKNIKAYLLTCLMNSITTIGNYYQAKVNHDMYGGDI